MANAKTILVIDDDPDVRFLCTKTLEAEGYVVTTAETGADGIARAEAERPDLVITDIMMERTDAGYCVVDKLGKVVPVIMFSSITNESDELFEPSSLPIRALLNKPLDVKRLVVEVKRVLERE